VAKRNLKKIDESDPIILRESGTGQECLVLKDEIEEMMEERISNPSGRETGKPRK
jgi:hypothetical protein